MRRQQRRGWRARLIAHSRSCQAVVVVVSWYCRRRRCDRCEVCTAITDLLQIGASSILLSFFRGCESVYACLLWSFVRLR